ncbi:hypothetical protein PVL30_003423 [Lodderomyces elongisporus]|uniref:uncharacterized protein n=1 Tax=Lodderomyces elongisporus TaxID=36914 RepID=UPI0029233C7B|nr:uncharacterized protein PVL30_003423 [Lodderomyces elongisporus]WLF79666.1 hypothetical protein PVL30_003423 [Lodderomyces elongisporus]
MSAVAKLTIPESSYNLASYNLSSPKSKSQLLIYLIKLTHGASVSLIIAYAVGFLILKPLLEQTASRRLDLLECVRGNLREFYLKAITKINYVPIVAIRRQNKLLADAAVQTESTGSKEEGERDPLMQNELHSRLKKIATFLQDSVRSYSMEGMSNYRSINYSIKDFQNKADLVYFNEDDFFLQDNVSSISNRPAGTKTRKKNIVVETKNEIRSIKGLFMSGQI